MMAIDEVNLDVSPCPTIMAGGIGGGNCSQYYLEDDGKPSMKTTVAKLPYRVPSMSEIEALPWNGLNVVSTFSGCGGSCLGYRMAGFRVLWANEFVPAAQASYKANMSKSSILDGRDIRSVNSEEILAAIGLKSGELDLFDGSPPCQAFSTAGKREKGWGKTKTYEHGARQCNETLFDEYIRLLRGLMPKVFVAENVSGLVKGTAKGYFLEILGALKAAGYVVEARLLDAQWLGVPQARQRLIFVGVRSDLGMKPAFPKPFPYRYSVRDALPWIRKIEGANGFNGHAFQAATIQAQRTLNVEVETDISRYAIGREWDKMKPGEQSEKYRSLVRPSLDFPCPTVTCPPGAQFSPTAPSSSVSVVHPTEKRKFSIAELRRICAFPDDFKLVGSYAQQWERLGNSVPPVMMMHVAGAIRDRIFRKLSA